MRNSYKKLVIEKGVDLSIVVLGILIALSFNSCKDNRRMKIQWSTFKEQLQNNINEELVSLKEDQDHYAKSIVEAASLSKSIKNKQVDIKKISAYLNSMGVFHLSLPRTNNYHAFLRLNNSYLTKDYDRFSKIDNYFSYKDTAEVYLDLYVQQLTPDLRNFLKEYRFFAGSQEGVLSKDKAFLHDTMFIIRSFSGLQKGLSSQVKAHIKDSEELLEILKSGRD